MLCYTMALRPRESFLGLLTMASGALVYRWFFQPKPLIDADNR
jgi:hypothetical protein